VREKATGRVKEHAERCSKDMLKRRMNRSHLLYGDICEVANTGREYLLD